MPRDFTTISPHRPPTEDCSLMLLDATTLSLAIGFKLVFAL